MELINTLVGGIFSKNPIRYQWCITPFGTAQQNENIYSLVKVEVENDFLSDSWTLVKTIKLFPDQDGVISTDIASIVDAHLDYFIPPANLDNNIPAVKQFKQFRISCELYDGNGNSIPLDFESPVFTFIAHKAGLPYEYPDGADNFTVASNRPQKPAFLFTNGKERVLKEDLFFLFFSVPPQFNTDTVYAQYTLTYWDGSAFGTLFGYIGNTFTIPEGANNNTVNLIPAGYNQLGLDDVLNAAFPDGNATAVSYTIKIYGGFTGSGSSEPYEIIKAITFTLDNRKFYNTKQLLYRNSLGGLQPLRLMGAVDFAADYNADNVEKQPLPSWIVNKNVTEAQQRLWPEEQTKFTGNTGWITRFEAERLRDLFISDQIFEVKDGRLVPVVINSNSAKFYSNNDTLFNIEIEYRHAFVNTAWSPAVLPADACPAMISLSWRQTADNKINIFWRLPFGYDYFKLKVLFSFDSSFQEFYVEGNSGTKQITLVRPGWATEDTDIVVSGKVVCNRYNKVPSYGAEFTVDASTFAADWSVVALNDYEAIGKGYTIAVDLRNALLNDYDPDGGPIEAVADSGSTHDGGAYTIASDGSVTYQPPSDTYTGLDYFTYQVKRTGGTVTKTATYYILVYDY